MKNTGTLIANDFSKDRIPALVANIHRMGVKNCIVTNYNGLEIKTHLSHFDRVLLDAPCTGLGIVSKDPSVKIKRDENEILKLAKLQKSLLLAAIDSVNYKSADPIIVYSTCSTSVEENEWVINYALNNRDVVLVETGLAFGKPGLTKHENLRFDESLKKTRRVYPHVYNMDGFFIAKFKKISSLTKKQKLDIKIEEEEKRHQKKEGENQNDEEDLENNNQKKSSQPGVNQSTTDKEEWEVVSNVQINDNNNKKGNEKKQKGKVSKYVVKNTEKYKPKDPEKAERKSQLRKARMLRRKQAKAKKLEVRTQKENAIRKAKKAKQAMESQKATESS